MIIDALVSIMDAIANIVMYFSFVLLVVIVVYQILETRIGERAVKH